MHLTKVTQIMANFALKEAIIKTLDDIARNNKSVNIGRIWYRKQP